MATIRSPVDIHLTSFLFLQRTIDYRFHFLALHVDIYFSCQWRLPICGVLHSRAKQSHRPGVCRQRFCLPHSTIE